MRRNNIIKTVFNEQYCYKGFSFIIKIIRKEWGLEGEGFCDDLNITSSKAFINIKDDQFQGKLSNALENMVDNIKESLQVYADHEEYHGKAPRYRRHSVRWTTVKC